MSDFYNKSNHKAKKDHKCSLCLTKITKGDEYIKVAQVFNGDFTTDKYHLLCYEYTTEYWESLDQYERMEGFTHDEVREVYKLHLPHRTVEVQNDSKD